LKANKRLISISPKKAADVFAKYLTSKKDILSIKTSGGVHCKATLKVLFTYVLWMRRCFLKKGYPLFSK